MLAPDPPYSVLGFSHHEDLRMPIDDATVTDGKVVIAWLTGFFDHSIPPSFPSTPILDPKIGLGRTPVPNPPPTIATIPPEEIQNVICIPPAAPGGSDVLPYEAGQRLGLFEEMRKKALYATAENLKDVTEEKKKWRESVEVRIIWCDRSIWGVPWGISQLYREVEDAKAKGELSVGEVNIVRMTGANHYVRKFRYSEYTLDTENGVVLGRFIERNLSGRFVLSWLVVLKRCDQLCAHAETNLN